MFKNNIELAAWCKEKAGCPYWYGTFGQTASESLLQQKKAQYPKHYADSRLKKCAVISDVRSLTAWV